MKSYSTVKDTWRGPQSYMEKRRGRRETEVTRGEEGESKGKRAIYPAISSLSVLHSPEHTERFTELRRAKEKGDRDDQEEKRGSQKERDRSSH